MICPHKNTALFDGTCSEETWLEGDLEMLRRCDALVRLPNWRASSGARREVKEAREHSIPVWNYPDEVDVDSPTVVEVDVYTEYDYFMREWE